MWGAIAGGALGAIGSIVGAGMSSSSAKSNMASSIAWERERAKNAHQWEVEDLKKAGLNPILSAGGSGAVTSGVTGQLPDTSGYSSAGQLLNQGIQNAITDKQTNSNIELQSAQKGLVTAQEANEIEKNPTIQPKAKAEISNLKASTTKLKLENQYQEETMQSRITKQFASTEKEVSEGRISIDNAKFLEKYGITREEALKLGSDGLKIIGNMVTAKATVGEISKAKTEMLKAKKLNKNSAKKL